MHTLCVDIRWNGMKSTNFLHGRNVCEFELGGFVCTTLPMDDDQQKCLDNKSPLFILLLTLIGFNAYFSSLAKLLFHYSFECRNTIEIENCDCSLLPIALLFIPFEM